MEELNSNSGVYKIVNKINGKIYIGSTVNFKDRFRDHKKLLRHDKHPNQHLQNSWNKYGEDNFEFLILSIVIKDKDLLLKEEQKFIDELNVCDNSIGYNISETAGSTFGYRFSEKSKEKMSKAKLKSNSKLHEKILIETLLGKDKDYYFTNESISVNEDKDITNPFYGKRHSNESKEKMSKAKMGNKNPHFNKGPMLGKEFTEEHKNKIGSANSGKNNKSSKPIIQYDLDMNIVAEWDSAGMAARALKLSVGNIWMCCNGKARTSYGFIWRYKNKKYE